MEKRLYRSRTNKMLGGVCGGLGIYFDIDPVLVRVIFVAGTFVTGVGLLAYILLWIIVPFEPVSGINQPPYNQEPANDQQAPVQKKTKGGGAVFGTILILIGLIFLADNFIPFFRFWDFWPIILIALGAGLLLKAKN